MAGYSGTPLAKKLGIKDDFIVAALHAPKDFASLLEQETSKLREAVFPDRSLWLAWPKKASKLPTDITEDVIREDANPALA